MHKIKHTFKRSKTPTGADMKIQSSLEVPKQIRSASFDEMKLGSHRTFSEQSSVDSTGASLLQVPGTAVVATNQRSKSFDSYGSSGSSGGGGGISPPEETVRMFLDVPGRVSSPRKKSSGDKSGSVPCIHCFYLEELSKAAQLALHSRQSSADENVSSRSLTHSDTSTSDYSDSESEYADEENSTDASECMPVSAGAMRSSPFRITVTLSPNTTEPAPAISACASVALPPASPAPSPPCTLNLLRTGDECAEEQPPTTSRRRSITSPKLERQEAFIFNEIGDNPPLLLEQQDSGLASPTPKPDDVIVSEFFLQVPDLKRDRAVSVDSCFIQKSSHAGKPEEVVPVPPSQLLEPPSLATNNAARSKSVDIVLPTEEQAHYKALSTGNTLSIAPRFQDTVVPSTAVSVAPTIVG